MIGQLLGSMMGGQAGKEDGQSGGLGSLLVIGIVVFVLLGGLKLFQKPEDSPEENC